MIRRTLAVVTALGFAALSAVAVAAPAHVAATGASGKLLSSAVGLYPRLIELQHSGTANGTIVASDVTFTGGDGADGVGAIWASHDDGSTFTRIGGIRDPQAAAGKGLCCATLYELPRQVGALPAGTLLWSASIGQSTSPRQMTIRVWASRDHGHTWSLLATPATAPNDLGLWEPEFTVTRGGRLAVFFSDETDQPAHSQQLDEAMSTDGHTWSAWHPVVSSDDPDARPGMANVRRLADGSYLMTYEVCGGSYGCAVYYRLSTDAVQWGDPTDLGATVAAANGSHFVHTPTIALTGSGRIYLVGQIYATSDGTTSPRNGHVVLYSDSGPAGPWHAMPAPVAVPSPYDNYCPNYSSPLLPLANGQLLEIATSYAADGVCKAYYGT